MSELKMGVGATNEWYTPPFIFEALGVEFDLDPCSPSHDHWVPARYCYVKADDGLNRPWFGTVFMNPPFGGRNGHIPWLRKFFNHGNGIALVRAYTSSGWFHEFAPQADGMLFPKGKTKFIRSDGSVGGSPSSGVVLLACGPIKKKLKDSGLGIYLEAPSQYEAPETPNAASQQELF